MANEKEDLIRNVARLAEVEFLEAARARRLANLRYEESYVLFLEARRTELLMELPADISSLREQLHKEPDFVEINEKLEQIMKNLASVTPEVVNAIASVQQQTASGQGPIPSEASSETRNLENGEIK